MVVQSVTRTQTETSSLPLKCSATTGKKNQVFLILCVQITYILPNVNGLAFSTSPLNGNMYFESSGLAS